MNQSSYKETPLNDWIEMFNNIYGRQNIHLSNEKLWLHVVEEVAELAEDLRKQYIKPRNDEKGNLTGILVNIADTFAWYSAFSSRFGSLEEILWEKYPAVCPYCFVDENCGCISNKIIFSEEDRLKKLQEQRLNKQNVPKTLYEWQKMFDKIYGKINCTQTVEQIGLHLTEEIGEVAKAIRIQKEPKLRNEIADVFGWTVSLIGKCERSTSEEYRLDDIIWNRFPNQCPHCFSNPCTEKIFK